MDPTVPDPACGRAPSKIGAANRPGPRGSLNREQQLAQLLAKDPVWKRIVAARNKKGPNRPVTEEEKAAIGTRADPVTVGHYSYQSDQFYKILENAKPDRIHDAERAIGGQVPSFFNLVKCRSCVAGAAYAKSRDSYPLSRPALVCTNQTCYQKKLAGDEVAHREKVETELMAVNQEDRGMIKMTMGRLAVLTRTDLRTLASTLIAAQPELALTHTMGVPHKKWSYKTVAVKYVTGLLEHQPPHFDRYGGNNDGKAVLKLESLDQVPDDDLLELTATLMTFHLRQAGKLDDGSRDMDAAPDPLAVREMLVGETETANVTA